MRILIVEDSSIDAQVIAYHLEVGFGTSCEIMGANCLKEALYVLNKNNVDVILLDLGLPDSKGINTFRKIYENTKSAIIIISGEDKDSIVKQALSEGAQDFLQKGSCDGNILIKSINYAKERKLVLDNVESQVEQRTNQLKTVSKFVYELTKVQTWILHHDILDNEIDYLIRKFGKVLGADRVCVHAFRKCTKKFRLKYTWSNGNCPEPLGELSAVSDNREIFLYRCIKDSLPFSRKIRDMEDQDIEILDQLSAKSIITVPIPDSYEGGSHWGTLTFIDCSNERQWQQFEINCISTIGPVISWVLDKMKRNNRMHKINDKSLKLVSNMKNISKEIHSATELLAAGG